MAADSLVFYDENLDTVSELREEISNTIRNEMVDDYASKELRQIRSDILKCEEQMKQKAALLIDEFRSGKLGQITLERPKIQDGSAE